MSRLIFEGDTISRFGKKIPTPFIEKIEVGESSITPTISIYLHITDDNDTNQQIYDDLSNLKLFYGFGEIQQQSIDLDFDSNFILVSENIYNSSGNRFAKFTFSRQEPYRQEFTLQRALSDAENRETYFSCFIAVVNDEANNRNTELLGISSDDEKIKEFDRRGTYNIYSNVASPLVYEKIFTAPLEGFATNRLAIDPIVIYEDSQGTPCESTPLYSIQKNYYKTTDSFREQLKTEIDDLVASYGTTSDQQLQSFLDSISFIAQTKNRDVDFITELDKVRNSFPSRTSTSSIGTLYNRLKDILFSANDALVLGTQLRKRIVPNTKLIDNFGVGTSVQQEWERRTNNRANDDFYNPRVDDTGRFLYNTILIERQEIETIKIKTLSTGESIQYDFGSGLIEPNYDVISTFGYFFFDYEKALHKKSNISQIYDVQKLLNIFGNNSLDSFLRFSKTELLNFHYGGLRRKLETTYSEGIPDVQKTIAAQDTDPVMTLVFKAETPNPSVKEIPYVMPRAFETAGTTLGTAENVYRLIPFEFQDYEKSDQGALNAGKSYRFNIYMDDNTLDLHNILVAQFEEAIARTKAYLDFASEFCSYNNIDGRFNDFFAEAITREFDFINYIPWEEAPKIYTIHVDLINNSYAGQKNEMIKQAKYQSSLISPSNGTLEELEKFVLKLESFYENYYSSGGVISRLISSRRDTDGNVQPSLRDNVDLIFTNAFGNIPNTYDLTVDPEEPISIKFWNGNERFINGPAAKAFINTRAATLAMARSKGDNLDEYLEESGGYLFLEGLDVVFEPGALRRLLRVIVASGAGGVSAAIAGLAGWFAAAGMGPALGTALSVTFAASGVAGAVVGGIVLVGLIVVMIIDRTKRQRVRRLIRFIDKFMSRLPTGTLTYQERKDAINVEIDLAIGNDDDRPARYKQLTNNDQDFLRENRAVFGNLGLVYIKAEKKNLIRDTGRWFRSKTRNIRN